jgi:RNA polymerase sigma-70 factor (ECF subfamily)
MNGSTPVRTIAPVEAAVPAPATVDAAPAPDVAAAYREHAPLVWRALRRFGVEEAELEDALHEVFLVLHRRRDDYHRQAALSSWLYGIARGVARNRRRGLLRWRARAVVPRHHGAPDTEDLYAQRHAVQLMERFLATLDPARREVFVLMAVERLSAPEVSGALGVNVNTVYTRLRAAKEAFATFTAQLDAPEDSRHPKEQHRGPRDEPRRT